LDKKSGVEIAFLNLTASAQRIFSGQVDIRTDVGGNIDVSGRGDSKSVIGIGGESRRISMINVFEVAVASRTANMRLGLTLSHSGDKLDLQDVDDFFSNLEAPSLRLLPPGTSRTGVEALRERNLFSPGLTRAGELRVWMELNEQELLRMLQIQDPEAGPFRNPFDDKLVRDLAIDNIVNGVAVAGSRVTLRNMTRLAEKTGLGNDLASGIKAMANGRRPGQIDIFSTDGKLLDRMERVGQRAAACARMLKMMREVYFSGPLVQSGRWTDQDFLQRQRQIDQAIQFWFTAELEDNFSFKRLIRKGQFLNPKIRPHGLALLRTFKTLASGDNGLGSPSDGEQAPLLASILTAQADTETQQEFVLA
jgi:hypothetical protein